jgi:tetratricopeptide (TPR) repeat protein
LILRGGRPVTAQAAATSAPGGPAPTDPVASRIATARGLLEARRAAEALIPAQQAAAMAPTNMQAQALLTEVQAALANGDQDLVRLELTAVLNPDDAANHLALGEAYVAADRAHDAERCFKRALALGRIREAHADLANLYLSVEMLDAAHHHARAVLAANDEGRNDDTLIAMAHQTLAAACQARGEREHAERHLDQAYARQSLFRQPAPRAAFTTLVLVSRSAGNIAYALLMPRQFDRTVWYMEHARPEQVADLGRHSVVLNAIGDPDIALASREVVDAFLASCDKPVLNPPVRVAATFRHRIDETLAGIDGLVIPRTIRIAAAGVAAESLAEAVARAGLAPPVIIRPTGSHGGQGLRLAADASALAEVQLDGGDDAYVTAFHDYRSADGFYRKYRMIFVDRTPYAYHLAIGPHWMVHHQSAEMADDPTRIAEELAFLRDPERAIGARAMGAIRAVGQRLDLDYGGIDFSLTTDGQVLLFEANATMLTHLEPADGPFAAKNVYIAPILEAFQAHVAARAAGG